MNKVRAVTADLLQALGCRFSQRGAGYLQDAICTVAEEKDFYGFELKELIMDLECKYGASFKSVEKAMQRNVVSMLDVKQPIQYLYDLFPDEDFYRTGDITLKKFIRTTAIEVSKIAC